MTSPGIIKSALATSSRAQNSETSGSTVFSALYKPDLIKMSSPLTTRRGDSLTTRRLSLRSQEGEFSRRERRERTHKWIEENSG